jgi:hypothetical protein
MGWRSLFGSVLCATVIACARGVPAPPFTTPMDKVPAESIRTYLADLKWDTRDGAGDVQQLVVCGKSCRVGPLVGIFPERRIHHNKTKNLAEGAGRIIAKIINYDTTEGYPRLNIGAGDTVYWAVDSIRSVKRGLSEGRSLFISAEAMRTGRRTLAVQRPVRLFDHPDSVVKTSAARWVYDSTDYREKGAPGGEEDQLARMGEMMTWAVCKTGGCCR